MASEASPVVAVWDGGRRLAAFWSGEEPAPARFLAAETPSGRSQVLDSLAVGAGSDRPLCGVLPAGAQAASVILVDAAGLMRTILLNLDRLFVAERLAAGGPAVDRVALRTGDPDLGEPPLGPAPPLMNDGRTDATGLNRTRIGDDGVIRMLVGPFERPAEAEARTFAVSARLTDGGALIELHGPAEAALRRAPVLIAHLPAADVRAGRELAALDPAVRTAIEGALDALHASIGRAAPRDASGADPVAARRRGFALLRPTPAASAAGVRAAVRLDDFDQADEVLVITAGRGQLTFARGGESVAGASLVLREVDGGFVATAAVETYAPAEATRLATFGGGRALAINAHAPSDRQSDHAADALQAAQALLERAGADDAAPTSLAQALDAAFGAPAAGDPLTRLNADEDALAALRDRGADEQAAMLFLADCAPDLARRACAARLLPSPGRTADDLAGLLAWFEDPALSRRLAQAATAESGLDRAARRMLHEIAAIAGEVWLSADVAAEARSLLAVSDAASGRRSELDALLGARDRRGPRGAAATWDLDRIARMRFQLVEAAVETGQSETLRRELGARLLSLAPGDIVTLHETFIQILRERVQADAARATIAGWEAAGGVAGLAERRRPGDVLAGAALLAKAGSEAVRGLARIDALAPAMAAVERQTADALGETPEPSARTEALGGILLGYGRLLALHMVRREADAALARRCAALPDDRRAGLAAEGARLRAGAVETLDRYLALAAVEGDVAWGTALNSPDATPAAVG